MPTQLDLLDSAIAAQSLHRLAEPSSSSTALWRVRLSIDAGREWRIGYQTWQGYAASSTDACGKALAWAAERVNGEPAIKVVEALRVGV